MRIQISSRFRFGAVVLLFLGSCAQKPKCTIDSDITYTKHIAPLIEAKCFECHAPDKYKQKASRVRIFNYQFLKEKAESGILLGALTHQKGYIPMPYRKGKKIDTCSIATIAAWIQTGLKK